MSYCDVCQTPRSEDVCPECRVETVRDGFDPERFYEELEYRWKERRDRDL